MSGRTAGRPPCVVAQACRRRGRELPGAPPTAAAAARRGPIVWRSSLKNTVYDVLRARPGWQETEHETAWDFFWADKGCGRAPPAGARRSGARRRRPPLLPRSWIHHELDKTHLADWQRINHFPNHYELTRKDLLIKNLKRTKRQLEREARAAARWPHGPPRLAARRGAAPRGDAAAAAAARRAQGRGAEAGAYAFFPASYVLPGEYRMFVEEFKRSGGTWIMKPTSRAQGQGIFLDWRRDTTWRPEAGAGAGGAGAGGAPRPPPGGGGGGAAAAAEPPEAYLAQRYVDAPYLVGGKKFDLRIYALVTSHAPLRVHLYRSGFARFTNVRFSMRKQDIGNAYVHLTNVAIQKHTPGFHRGMKWPIRSLRLYLTSRHGADATNELFAAIQGVVLRALLAVQPAMINDKHSFEARSAPGRARRAGRRRAGRRRAGRRATPRCSPPPLQLYGYDVLIDSALKPWLLEVNASPSLTASDRADWELKFGMLNVRAGRPGHAQPRVGRDMLDIVDLEGRREPGSRPPARQGGFDLVWDGGPVSPAAQPESPTTLGCWNCRDQNQQRRSLAELAAEDAAAGGRCTGRAAARLHGSQLASSCFVPGGGGSGGSGGPSSSRSSTSSSSSSSSSSSGAGAGGGARQVARPPGNAAAGPGGAQLRPGAACQLGL
ncbi:Ttll9 [Scenedesmus sp. PABB004]|nr:Ttll9 [Scenedesmus sp. PABB004]